MFGKYKTEQDPGILGGATLLRDGDCGWLAWGGWLLVKFGPDLVGSHKYGSLYRVPINPCLRKLPRCLKA